jgi:hypothetical protein
MKRGDCTNTQVWKYLPNIIVFCHELKLNNYHIYFCLSIPQSRIKLTDMVLSYAPEINNELILTDNGDIKQYDVLQTIESIIS